MSHLRNKASISFLIFAGLIACGPAPELAAPQAAQAVRVQALESREVIDGRRVLAEVSSPRNVRLLAELPATVAVLHVAVGAEVEAGRPLLSLSSPDLAARAVRVTAERARADRERDFACTRLETDRELAATGDLPADPLAASERSCDAATHAASAAEAAEREVNANLARGAVRAPVSGTLLALLVDVGQPVMPGTPLGVFAGGPRELLISLPEPEAAGLAVGDAVQFEGGAATIREIGARAIGPARLVEVRAEVTHGAERLPRHGGTLEARVVRQARTDTVAAPLAALATDDAGDFVVVVEGDRATRAEVQKGPTADGWVALDVGPPAGARVVVGEAGRVDLSRAVFAVEVTP